MFDSSRIASDLVQFLPRLGAMSEKKINQDQRITENTLSVNRQSDLEEEFKNNFKDGERVVAIELIENKSQSCHFSKSTKDDHLKASRLACLIFEVRGCKVLYHGM